MTHKEPHKTRGGYHPTLMEAVATLSEITEMPMEALPHFILELDVNVDTLLPSALPNRAIALLKTENTTERISMVKEIFRIILKYLRKYYKRNYYYASNPKTVEGIKEVMVLVGEAAKKLDQYAQRHGETAPKSVTHLQEYRNLQEFYLTRIAKKVDESVLGHWIFELAQRLIQQGEEHLEQQKSAAVNHIYVDLEAVKTDAMYELFFIRKEDGTRFFNPRLIRNMKLVCDFGERSSDDAIPSTKEYLEQWRNQIACQSATSLLQAVRSPMEKFYRFAAKDHDEELIEPLNKSLIALILAGNAHNLSPVPYMKGCHQYLQDFQTFLRKSLVCSAYQKFMAYPTERHSTEMRAAVELLHSLCGALFLHVKGYQAILPDIQRLIHEESLFSKKSELPFQGSPFSEKLSEDYALLSKAMKQFPGGPLEKVLEILERDPLAAFDPLLQQNAPNYLFDIFLSGLPIHVIHLPSPTSQTVINQPAALTEEFRGFLSALAAAKPVQRHLIFNLQDRAAWQEQERSITLEDVQSHADFSKELIVVTLAKDTEFYHQLAPYLNDNHFEVFASHFKELLQLEGGEYFFPKSIYSHLFPRFVDQAIQKVHQLFFGGKNVLSLEKRLDFIEIFYLILEMKIMQIAQPSSISFTCKDGVDIGAPANAAIYYFSRILEQKKLTQEDLIFFDLLLYAPALLLRQRMPFEGRSKRFFSMLRTLESAVQELGEAWILKELTSTLQ